MPDFSCYVTITISPSVPEMATPGGVAAAGTYVSWPEMILDAETSSTTFQLQSDDGSQGSVDYLGHDYHDFRLHVNYADPAVDANVGTAMLTGTKAGPYVIDLWTKTGDGSWQYEPMPASGHPVYLFVGVRRRDEPQLSPIQP